MNNMLNVLKDGCFKKRATNFLLLYGLYIWYYCRAENVARRAAGEEPLPEEDPNNIVFKVIPEPSRLDSYLITNQISNYCSQVNGYGSYPSDLNPSNIYALQGSRTCNNTVLLVVLQKNHMQQRGLDMSIIDQNFDMSSSCHIANVFIQMLAWHIFPSVICCYSLCRCYWETVALNIV